jgi:hypothetical protein
VSLNQNVWTSRPIKLPDSLVGPYNYLSAIGDNIVLSDINSENLFFLSLDGNDAATLASSYNTGGRILRISSTDNFLYVCDAETGLHKLDMSDLTNPVRTLQIQAEGIVRDVVETDKFILLAADGQARDLGIEIYKKRSDGTAFKYRRKVTPGIVTSLQKVGDLIYAIDNLEGSSTLLIMRLNLQ